MHKKNKHRWLSTKKVENTGSATPLPPIKTDTPLPAWFRTIATCPLTKFIDVSVDGNLAALTISGMPAQSDLLLAWSEIKQQYADAMGDGESIIYLCLYRDLVILSNKIQSVKLIIESLRRFYYEPLAAELNDMLNTNFQFNPYDNEAYQKLLDRCSNIAKAFKIDFDLNMIHFKAIQAKQETKGGANYTREYFQSVLITLSDYAKFPVQDSITVFEFCTRIKRYNSYCEQLEKANRK